jgi:peptidoglycan/LPS O-acetylase OafA/YrhL
MEWVDLCFVLSGLLMGGIVLDARDSSNYFRAFYAWHCFRIIPMYLIIFFAVVATVGVASLSWRFFEKHLIRRSHVYSYAKSGAESTPAGFVMDTPPAQQ